MARALRLGLVGTGVAARELYAPALRELEGKVTVVACANRTRHKAENYAKVNGIPKVVGSAEELIALAEVDAVLFSLPIELQPQYVLKALRFGKPVLSEKPIAPSVAVGRRLVKSASRIDVPWLVGENFAFMHHTAKLKQWLDSGRLGDIRLVQVTQMTYMDRANPYFNTPWRKKPGHVGGFIVDGGVHLANVVRRCFGMPTQQKAIVGGFDKKLPPFDTALAVMRFESGAMGTWTSCFSAHYEGPMVRVFGSRGTAELSWDTLTLRTASGKVQLYKNTTNSFAVQFDHFRNVVQRGIALAVTPEEALADLAFVEQICLQR